MAVVAILALVVLSCGVSSAVPLHSDSQHVLAELRDSVNSAASTEAQTQAELAQGVAFNGGEHWLIGDEAWSKFVGQAKPAFPLNIPVFHWADTGLKELTFGQTVMMHADLYADMTPISNGFKQECVALTSTTAAAIDKSPVWSSGAQTFATNFGLLQTEMIKNGGKEAGKLVGWLKREKNAILRAKQAGSKQASTDGYKDVGALRSQTGEDLITKGVNPHIANSGFFIPELHAIFNAGRFLKLANENVDHFAPCSHIAYAIGHKEALLSAALGTKDGLSKAIRLEAMAHHFLTDTFSSGHVRVPRAVLDNKCGRIGALGTKAMHDEDGHFGLNVMNARGNKWTAFGDTRLEDDVAKKHRAILLEAMITSINEVWKAFNTKSAALTKFAAFDLFPQFDPNGNNHPALLKPQGTDFYYRESDGSYKLIDWKLKCAFVPLAKLRVDNEIKANKLENGQGPKTPLP